MKNENQNLENNISRLVKLTGDSDKPNKAFTDSLINDALGELQGRAGRQRERRSTTMTAKKLLAYAAAVIVVCAVAAALLMPPLYRSKSVAVDKSNKAVYQSSDEKDFIKKSAELKSGETPTQSKIEYTVKGEQKSISQPVASSQPQSPSGAGDKFDVLAVGRSDQSLRGRQPAEHFMVMDSEKKTRLSMERSATKGEPLRFIDRPYCYIPPKPICPPLMAHGGTTPPNGEDVDAMFFKNYGVNPFIDTEDDHLSTFATDVDTASYTVVRGYLHDGHLPPNDAVRVEEFVNYFKYDYQSPKNDDFAVYAEASPWQFGSMRQNSYLLRLALKARQISDEDRKPAVLTFVIDVSGSMSREDRLGLVKKSLRLLIDNLKPEDRIGIAVYESRGRKVMDHKGLTEKDDILATIDSLTTGGSTYAEEGIRIGYEMAQNAFKPGYINRVILCTDGVANVGQTGADDILKVIKEKAEKGITLSAIGFGMGNYNDVLLEQLGDKGNGHYAYVDTIAEAKRVFEENLTGTLQVIARDAKVQVDFNPEVVRSYRLIGYENRDVPDDKFRDDKYDGGEVGAGHSVTALYEIKLWPDKKGKIATTFVRYKKADNGAVTEFKSTLDTGKLNRTFDGSSKQFRLAATVAEFAEVLRNSYWAKDATLDPVLKQAQRLAGEFNDNGDVIELVDLISKANQLVVKPSPKTVEEEAGE